MYLWFGFDRKSQVADMAFIHVSQPKFFKKRKKKKKRVVNLFVETESSLCSLAPTSFGTGP